MMTEWPVCPTLIQCLPDILCFTLSCFPVRVKRKVKLISLNAKKKTRDSAQTRRKTALFALLHQQQ